MKSAIVVLMLMPWTAALGDLVAGVRAYGDGLYGGEVDTVREDGTTAMLLSITLVSTVYGVGLAPDGRVIFGGDGWLFAVPLPGKPIPWLSHLWYGHDFAFDRSGGMFAGNAYGGVFNVVPNGEARFLFSASESEPVSIDLAADQCTLYYVSPTVENIGRYDVCRETPLPPLARAPTKAHEIRITRTGFVVHAQNGIARYDTRGELAGFVATPPATYSSGLAFSADGSIWVATDGGIYLVDPGTGAILRGPFLAGSAISGIAVVGEWRAATSPASADVPALSPAVIALLAVMLAVTGAVACRLPAPADAASRRSRRRSR